MAQDKNNPSVSKGGSGKLKRQGHTASTYGSEPNMDAKGAAGKTPRELRP